MDKQADVLSGIQQVTLVRPRYPMAGKASLSATRRNCEFAQLRLKDIVIPAFLKSV
jgi:hypothetical protein